RVADAAQYGRVPPVGDPRDLGSGEGDDLILGIVTKIGVEGMKIPSGRPHDEDTLDYHTTIPFHCREARALTAGSSPIPHACPSSISHVARAMPAANKPQH